jgi:hypothetical protein
MSDIATAQQQELFASEARIEDARRTITRSWVIIGQELRTIHDRNLWRHTHQSFEVYCRQRWDYSLTRAYDLMQAEAVVHNLQQPDWTADVSQIREIEPPRHESHVHPLRGLAPAQQREAWRQAEETAPAGGLTARHVKQTVQNLYGKEVVSVPQRSGYEDSLNDLHSRVLALTGAIASEGGIKLLWQDWTHERQREFLQQVASIEGAWTVFAAEVQGALPQTPVTLVHGGAQ